MPIEAQQGVTKKRPHGGTKDIECIVCSRLYENSKCVNAGDKVYATWRCKPCHNAVRILERSADSKGQEAKDKSALLRKLRKDQWRRMVCAIRLAYPDDEMNEYDRDETLFGSGAGPSVSVHKAIDVAASGLEVKTSVTMMTKRQFKAHFVQTELYTKDEAETFWQNCIINHAYHKETEDGVVTLVVKLPKVYSGSVIVGRTKQAEESKDVPNITECAKQVRRAPDVTRELIAGQSAFACLLPGASVEVAESDGKKVGLKKENLARFGSMAASDIMTPPSKRARSWVQMSQALSVVGGSVLGGESPAGEDRDGWSRSTWSRFGPRSLRRRSAS